MVLCWFGTQWPPRLASRGRSINASGEQKLRSFHQVTLAGTELTHKPRCTFASQLSSLPNPNGRGQLRPIYWNQFRPLHAGVSSLISPVLSPSALPLPTPEVTYCLMKGARSIYPFQSHLPLPAQGCGISPTPTNKNSIFWNWYIFPPSLDYLFLSVVTCLYSNTVWSISWGERGFAFAGKEAEPKVTWLGGVRAGLRLGNASAHSLRALCTVGQWEDLRVCAPEHHHCEPGGRLNSEPGRKKSASLSRETPLERHPLALVMFYEWNNSCWVVDHYSLEGWCQSIYIFKWIKKDFVFPALSPLDGSLGHGLRPLVNEHLCLPHSKRNRQMFDREVTCHLPILFML